MYNYIVINRKVYKGIVTYNVNKGGIKMSLNKILKNHVVRSVAIMGIVPALVGCRDPPYYRVNINDLIKDPLKYEKTRVVVKGISTLSKEDITVIKSVDNEESIIVKRDVFREIWNRGEYSKASEAIKKEIKDSDKETITVIGFFDGSGYIKARYNEIEVNMYPVYR